MTITLSTQSPGAGDLIIPIEQTDELTNQLTGIAQKLALPASILQRDFKADAKEVLALYKPDGSKTYLLGLGAKPQEIDWLRAFRKLFFDQKTKLSEQLCIDLTAFDAQIVEAVVLGVRGGGYDLKLYQTDKPTAPRTLR
eukprot:TRINITY_DN7238_c0_g1_i1.p2 TRINITY_DN7238_c0_g1~~TRINITY_DN7238_c0_g1_i1.p2  ORF type:complete len:140 (+),score=6.07 TRINITY_DN7238_c0_g1_i1:602-1021(+)